MTEVENLVKVEVPVLMATSRFSEDFWKHSYTKGSLRSQHGMHLPGELCPNRETRTSVHCRTDISIMYNPNNYFAP